MSTNEQDWQELSDKISGVLSKHSARLGPETEEAVRHCLDHDKYEMAFEGLCLDLLTHNVEGVDWSGCVALALRRGLDKESTLDAELWAKLSRKNESRE